MAMTANSMATRRRDYKAAVSPPADPHDPVQLAAYAFALLAADSQGIIDEIHLNGQTQVAGVQAGGATVTGTIT